MAGFVYLENEGILNRIQVNILFLIGVAFVFSHTSLAVNAKEFSYSASDNLTGSLCMAIIKEAHERIGLKVHVNRTPSKRTLVYANDGVFDGALCRIKTITNDYPNLIRVGPSYLSIESFAYTKEPDLEILDRESLNPYMIGIHLGHKYAENYTKGLKVTTIGNDVQLVRMLESGNIDIAILIDMDALMAIKETKLKIRKLPLEIGAFPLYFYFHKKNMAYVDVMKNSIQEMIEAGRIEEIRGRVLEGYSGVSTSK